MKDNVPRLERVMGRLDVAGLIVTATVGAGILGLPGPVYKLAGHFAVAAVLVSGVLMGLVGLAFAEAGSRFFHAGGPLVYAKAAFGEVSGFAVGWMQAVSGVFSTGAVGNLAVTYVQAAFPNLERPGFRIALLGVIFAGITGLHLCGVKMSARAASVLTIVKLGLLAGFTVAAAPRIAAAPIVWSGWPGLQGFGSAVILMMFALGGMESIVVATAEMLKPQTDIPAALAMALPVITGLYAAVMLACLALVPDLGASAHPVYDAAVAMGGKSAGQIVSLCGAVSIGGIVFALLFGVPRVLFTLAEQGALPPFLSRVHPRFRTPDAAILLTGFAGFCISLSPDFTASVTMSVLARVLIYGATCLAALRLGHAAPGSERRGDLTQPDMPRWRSWACGAGAFLCLALAVNAGSRALMFLGLLTAPAVLAFAWNRDRPNRPA